MPPNDTRRHNIAVEVMCWSDNLIYLYEQPTRKGKYCRPIKPYKLELLQSTVCSICKRVF